MGWTYKREEKQTYTTKVPEGKHRVRIVSAEKAVSKTSNNDMLTIQLDISGYTDKLYHYIVFMPSNPELTNQKLTQFFDSFKDIPDGEFDMSKWVGKVGACTIKHDKYNGNVNCKVGYFIPADKQGDLPPWQEVDGMAGGTTGAAIPTDGFVSVPNGVELPF